MALLAALLAGLAGTPPALAADVALVGLFQNRAVVQINGSAPRTLSLNQKTAEGVTLLAVERGSATFEVDGRRHTLKLGQAVRNPSSATATDAAAAGAADKRASVTLAANSQGHFFTTGQVNSSPVNFVVDTGATLIALSTADARRIGLSFVNAPLTMMTTANGPAKAWRVKLDTVRVGDISIDNVDAVVMDSEGMPALLGNSFLNRMEMKRDGQMMTLIKRF